MVEKGQYCLSIEKVVELSNRTGISTDYILRGLTNTTNINVKEKLKGFTEEQIDAALEIVKQLTIVIKE